MNNRIRIGSLSGGNGGDTRAAPPSSSGGGNIKFARANPPNDDPPSEFDLKILKGFSWLSVVAVIVCSNNYTVQKNATDSAEQYLAERVTVFQRAGYPIYPGEQVSIKADGLLGQLFSQHYIVTLSPTQKEIEKHFFSADRMINCWQINGEADGFGGAVPKRTFKAKVCALSLG